MTGKWVLWQREFNAFPCTVGVRPRLCPLQDRWVAPAMACGLGTLMEYEEAKRLVSDPDPEVRREIAGREDLEPELIYFLSKDDLAAVRLAVAGNRNAPREADLLLARDPDDAVRARVGQKLGEGRPPDAKPLSAKKQALTVQVAETLATDNAEQVR